MSTNYVKHFYNEYHGHLIQDLVSIRSHLSRGRGIIYLVGDSTMDNKYWIHERVAACNGYEEILAPPKSVPDIAYWVNATCVARGLGSSLCCINAAIEESTLGLRHGGALLPQDKFVNEHIGSSDVLVVSCGGNDIALRPSLWTIASIIALLASPEWLISSGWAPGFHHFVRLFRDETAAYIRSLIGQAKPRCVVVGMLYYLDETPGGSWAEFTLQKLGYNTNPGKLQLIMRMVFKHATSKIEVDGIPVVPVPFYDALDGTDSSDYVQRVEPSSRGGEKLAKLILDHLEPVLASHMPVVSRNGLGGHDASDAPPAVMPAAVHLASRRRDKSPS